MEKSDDSARFAPMIIEEVVRPPYPVTMTLDTTSFCNARCKMCPYAELSQQLPMGTIEEALFEKIVDDFAALGRKYAFRPEINFCNLAEPFLDPRVIEHTQMCLERGMEVYFNTNAQALTAQKVDRLRAIGFQGRFVLNVSGITPEVYEAVMGVPQRDTLEKIEYLIERHPREKICVQASVVGWPASEFRKAKRYWAERSVHFSPILPNSRAGLVPWLFPNTLKRVMSCGWDRVLKHIVITFQGEVVLCCQDMRQEVELGNLGEQSIEEVWNGPAFRQIVKKIYRPEHSGADLICARCEYALSSRGPWARLKKNLRHEVRKAWHLRHLWGL